MTTWQVQPRVTIAALPLVAALLALRCGGPPRQQANANSAQSPEARSDARAGATLDGLTGVFVVLDGLSSDVEALGLRQSEMLREIEGQLRSGGVRLLPREEARTSPGSPYLYVSINVVQASADYAYSVRIELNQAVHLERATNVRTMATTWRPSAVLAGIGPTSFANALRQDVRAQVALFVDDYRNSNRRRS